MGTFIHPYILTLKPFKPTTLMLLDDFMPGVHISYLVLFCINLNFLPSQQQKQPLLL